MAEPRIALDVRRIPRPERHARIFDAFDGLPEDGELRLTTDHEPRPLRAQFDELRGGSYLWIQRMIAIDLWHVTLRRVAAVEDRVEALLRRCPPFADASAATLRAVAAEAVVRELERDDAVVEEGRRWNGLGIVAEGMLVAVRTSADGREYGLYDVLPTETFGEMALIDGGVSPARFAAASARATVLLIPKAVVEREMRRDAVLARALAVAAVQRARVAILRFSAQSSVPTIARIAAVLLAYAGPQPGLQQALPTIKGVTQSQLAVAAGTVKEVVSRALMEMERAGAIERRGGRIARVDRTKLEGFAGRL